MHSLFLVTKQERWIYAEASKATAVVGHYHPFLSKLNSKVVSNDVFLTETMAGMFITGPNMAGQWLNTMQLDLSSFLKKICS